MFIASVMRPNVARITRRSGGGSRSAAFLCASGTKAPRRCSSRTPLINGMLPGLIALTSTGADKTDCIAGTNGYEDFNVVLRLDGWKIEARLLADPSLPVRGRRRANAPQHTCALDHVVTGRSLESLIFQFDHSGGHGLLWRHYVGRITKKDTLAILSIVSKVRKSPNIAVA
jgi:hypothetical protein